MLKFWFCRETYKRSAVYFSYPAGWRATRVRDNEELKWYNRAASSPGYTKPHLTTYGEDLKIISYTIWHVFFLFLYRQMRWHDPCEAQTVLLYTQYLSAIITFKICIMEHVKTSLLMFFFWAFLPSLKLKQLNI